jgi:hypothetical protein
MAGVEEVKFWQHSGGDLVIDGVGWTFIIPGGAKKAVPGVHMTDCQTVQPSSATFRDMPKQNPPA